MSAKGSGSRADYKIIHDPVHGSIKLEGLFLDLSQAPELQRLHGILQLGLAYLVFPGARHARFEHSMGAAWVAKRMAQNLGLDQEEEDLVVAATFLHDVGHGPYSHTLEYLLHDATGLDHMDVTKRIITGEYDVLEAGTDGGPDEGEDVALEGRRLPEVLTDHGLDPAEVASFITGDCEPVPKDTFGPPARRPDGGGSAGQGTLGPTQEALFGGRTYLAQMVHGPIDCDQIDFLLRDSHNTGVALGVIDLDRLLETVTVHGGALVVDRKGVSAVEGMLMARALMYSAVYFHKTVRIAELMLSRAAEELPVEALDDLPRLIDAELAARLRTHGGVAGELVRRLKYRRLYKVAYRLDADEVTEDQRKALLDLDDRDRRRRAERELANRCGLAPHEVILDVPARELLLSEPRIGRTEVPVLDEGRVRTLRRYTPVAEALAARRVPDFVCLVACPPAARDAVRRAAPTVLFDA